ncbi:MAG: MGDG synthase family glycosyltransferase [Peptococcales bacterium]|jgi:processive 1,2-diacylglycerol beta-glucosyltransferase
MVLPPLKILIFSVSIGAGHNSVANALTEKIKEESPDSEVLIVDTFRYINPILNKVVSGSYMETIKFTPKVWGYLYEQAEDGERLVDMGQVLSKLLSPKLDHLLKEFNPDVLICTHAFPAGILSVLKEKRNIKEPLITCITDFNVHSFWIHPQVDLFVIPSADLIYPFIDEKIDLNKVKAFGIPIRSQFSRKPEKEQVRQKLGLSDSRTILVMGGGLGLGKIERAVVNLLKESDLQILAVAGSNEKLKKNLERLKNKNRLHIYGFTENIAELMAVADVIVTKPGGITCAEALAMELPMAIISPLPGQEDRNTDYFINKGVAIKVRKEEHLVRELKTLCSNELRLSHMREMAAYLKKPYASFETIQAIWEMVQN